MWISNRTDNNKTRSAFYVGIMCGVIGILPDIDHVISFWIQPQSESRRIYHDPILFVCCLVLCSLIAYGGGLYIKYILRRK
jgi:hypothetical protein